MAQEDGNNTRPNKTRSPQNKASRAHLRTGNPAIDDRNLHRNENRAENAPTIFRDGTTPALESRFNASVLAGQDFHYGTLNDTDVGAIDVSAGRVALDPPRQSPSE